MLDIGWSELLLIGIVALIVVGPQDLPKLFHSIGRITAKARSMAREFSSAMEDAAKGSGLDDAANTLRDVKSLTSKKALGLDALERATDKFEKWDPVKPVRSQSAAAPTKSSDQGADAVVTPASKAIDTVETSAAPVATSTDPESSSGQRRLHAVRRSDTKDI